MGDKQDQIDEIQSQYDAELVQLEELQKRFDVLAEEYNLIMDERRIEVCTYIRTWTITLSDACYTAGA